MSSTAPPSKTAQKKLASKPTPVSSVATARTVSDSTPVWSVVRFLGSLQFAIVTGSIFTIGMIFGTCLESWYSGKIAQELVYHAWWFTLLLGMLACSIFFAAVKKWPWKRHQLGFLITHVGLLTMLAGGVLNAFFGVDAQMQLIDSASGSERSGIPQQSAHALLPDDYVVTVQRPKPDSSGWKTTELDVRPGPLAWGVADAAGATASPLIQCFAFLADPFPRNVNKLIDGDLRVEVAGYLPHVRVEPVEAAPPKAFGFPALKLEVNAADVRMRGPSWIVSSDQQLTNRMTNNPISSYIISGRGQAFTEILGQCHQSVLDEFLHPPAAKERGANGQLVLALKGEKYHIDVASQLGKTIPLGKSGFQVTLDKYFANFGPNQASKASIDPRVEFRVIAPDGQVTKYQAKGRDIFFAGALTDLEEPQAELPEGLPAVWFHPADLRYGLPQAGMDVKLMLQFAQTPDQKLYYRTLVEKNGEMVVDKSGPAPAVGTDQRIWSGHAASFIIEEYLPHARACNQRIEPVDVRPGLRRPDLPSALLCKLTLTKKTSSGKPAVFTKEKWLTEGSRFNDSFRGEVDGQPFQEPIRLGFQNKQIPLGFELELTRAESLVDPGTNSAATFSSFVKLTDEKAGIKGEDHWITMNEPLDYCPMPEGSPLWPWNWLSFLAGYKVYQSNFVTEPEETDNGKAIHVSGFTIGRDPGLWFKYIGTAMIGLGIATMFWMKAYINNPKIGWLFHLFSFARLFSSAG
jgi:hypothetical protein